MTFRNPSIPVNRICLPKTLNNEIPEVTDESHIKSGTVNYANLHEEIL